MNSRVESLMNDYYDALTAHNAKLAFVYNSLAEIWGKSKKPKTIQLVEEKDYTNGKAVIFNNEKYYVTALELTKDEVKVHLRNHIVDFFIADEICWYGNHEITRLIIDEMAKHLGYGFEPVIEDKKKKKRK